MAVSSRLYTSGPVGAWSASVLALPVALGFAVEGRVGIFVFAGVLASIMAARAPATCLGALLSLAAADLVLTVDVSGFTFRAAQVAAVALVAAAIAQAGPLAYARFVLSRAGMPMWMAFLAMQASHVVTGMPNASKGIGYLAWAGFDLLLLAPAVAWHARRHFARVVSWWWLGASLVALFGVGQLLFGVVGLEAPFVTQMIGPRPRINAFSYEPSYFAFQALIPLALLCGLVAAGRLTRGASATAAGALLLGALILSTSRSAWLGSALLLLSFVVVMLLRYGRDALPRLAAWRVIAACFALLVAAGALVPPRLFEADLMLATRALDVNESASAQPRKEGLIHAWRMFERHGVRGVGPGQFGGALLADPSIWVRDIPEDKRIPDDLVTFNVYLELLAESGALGALFVLGALAALLWRLWHVRGRGSRGRWAEGLLWPLVLTFGVMFHFNQTLWRTEAWCLVGLCWAFASPWRGSVIRERHAG